MKIQVSLQWLICWLQKFNKEMTKAQNEEKWRESFSGWLWSKWEYRCHCNDWSADYRTSIRRWQRHKMKRKFLRLTMKYEKKVNWKVYSWLKINHSADNIWSFQLKKNYLHLSICACHPAWASIFQSNEMSLQWLICWFFYRCHCNDWSADYRTSIRRW